MAQLRDKTDELKEAKMFAYAHTRYDRVAEAAAKGLAEPRADVGVQRDLNSAVGVLRSLAASLEEAKKNKDFRNSRVADYPAGKVRARAASSRRCFRRSPNSAYSA